MQQTIWQTGSQIKREGWNLLFDSSMAYLALSLSRKKYEQCDWLLATLYFPSQQVLTCSKVTIETLEQGVKYVQS